MHREYVPRSYHLQEGFSVLAGDGIEVLPLALKVAAAREESNALVHDRLAHPQVVLHPLLHARGLAELLGLYTGTGVSLLAVFLVMSSISIDVGVAKNVSGGVSESARARLGGGGGRGGDMLIRGGGRRG